MFVFFGNKTSVQPVRGGRQIVSECPSCGVTAKFHECEQKKTLNVYMLVDLFTDKQTVFRCTNCGELFELDEKAAGSESREQEAEGAARAERERVAAEARQKAAREEKARQREQRRAADKIEDELAALKRKLRSD